MRVRGVVTAVASVDVTDQLLALGDGDASLQDARGTVLVQFVVENGTNSLLAGGVVGGSIEQLVGVGRTASRKLVPAVPPSLTKKKGP
jgi:hypothetical protein